MLKPAETTPLTALLLAEVCQQAGLPPGVVNIVTGDGADRRGAGRHAGVDKVAFTGSTEVGKEIQRALSPGTGKQLTLELGGKAANIVFDDAPLDQAVEGIVNGIFFNQGHVCCAGSRLLVQESSRSRGGKAAASGWRRCASAIRWTRTPTSARSTRAQQLDKIRELSAAGEAEGAERWSPPCGCRSSGYWFAAHGVHRRQPVHRIAREEIFGPVLSVLTFRTPEEAVDEGEQHPVRAVGRASGPRRAAGSCGWRSGCGPGWSGPTRTTGSTRPARSAATSESGFGREGGGTGWPRTSMPDRKGAGRPAAKAAARPRRSASRRRASTGGCRPA